MRLHHHPLSSNSRRAVVTAKELGADVELVLVDLPKGEQRSPAYLKLNPNGRVPTLEDGDFVLWESHAIMQYLADKTPGQKIYPTDVRARADVNRWMFWTAHHWAPAVGVLGFERTVKKFRGLEPDPREEERGEKLVAECARVLDEHLAGKKWLAQDRLTLADISVAAPLIGLERARLPVMRGEEHPNIRAWFSRMTELPSWKAAAG